jgi:hypothetical protein
MSLAAVAGLLSATVAVVVIWLLITDPVGTADAASQAAKGDIGPIMQAIGAALVGALKGLFRYL